MPDPKQLPYLLRLLADDSLSVQAEVTKALLSFGASLEQELARLPVPPDTHQRCALQRLLEHHNQSKVRDAWPSWIEMVDDALKLEGAFALLAEYQRGMASAIGLNQLLNRFAEEYDATHPARDTLALAEFLFESKQLRGPARDFYNPRNSDLIHVIQSKRGLPISLVSIYILVGNRLGLNVEGCSFPGHFLARTTIAGERVYIDCFDGVRVIDGPEMIRMKSAISSEYDSIIEVKASSEVIIARVLRNLVQAYDRAADVPRRDFIRDLLESLELERARRKSSAPNQDAPLSKVRFRPGQLVRHLHYDYHGVVVQHDLNCEASESWYRSNRTQPSRSQPWYHVLVHGSTSCTYVAEENLEADPSALPVQHPLIENYFVGFQDGRYIRNDQPWGKE